MTEIDTIRATLAARAEGQPPAVKRAVANLDRWLEVLTEPPATRTGVDVKSCALAAVDALESALKRRC